MTLNLYKKKYVEDSLKDFYYQQDKQGQKEMRKMKVQENEIYIIIKNNIFKCIKYNEIHHVLENIEFRKKTYISWSSFWNSEHLSLPCAKERLKHSLSSNILPFGSIEQLKGNAF